MIQTTGTDFFVFQVVNLASVVPKEALANVTGWDVWTETCKVIKALVFALVTTADGDKWCYKIAYIPLGC